jgi:hypothetical protein
MIHNNITPAVLQCAFLAKYFEAFVSIDLHVLIRFGKWDELLRYPIPATPEVLCLPSPPPVTSFLTPAPTVR